MHAWAWVCVCMCLRMLGFVFMRVSVCRSAKTKYRRYILEQSRAHKKNRTAALRNMWFAHMPVDRPGSGRVFRDVRGRPFAGKNIGVT